MEGTVVPVVEPVASSAEPPWIRLERGVEQLARERAALDDLRLFRRRLAIGGALAAAMLAPVWQLASPLNLELFVTMLTWCGMLLVSRASLLHQLDRQAELQQERTMSCTTEVHRLLAASAGLLEP